MTRQEMAYLDAEVELLREHITTVDCSNCNDDWCFNHASQQARHASAAKYGCICGACCRKCINAKECGYTPDRPCNLCDICNYKKED